MENVIDNQCMKECEFTVGGFARPRRGDNDSFGPCEYNVILGPGSVKSTGGPLVRVNCHVDGWPFEFLMRADKISEPWDVAECAARKYHLASMIVDHRERAKYLEEIKNA